jgi:hypothetical protein
MVFMGVEVISKKVNRGIVQSGDRFRLVERRQPASRWRLPFAV